MEEGKWRSYTSKQLNRTLPFDTGTAILFVPEHGDKDASLHEDQADVLKRRNSNGPLTGEEARGIYESIVSTVSDIRDRNKTERMSDSQSHIEQYCSKDRSMDCRTNFISAIPSRMKRKKLHIFKNMTYSAQKTISVTDLFRSVQEGSLKDLKQVISIGCYDINLTDNFDWTLLMCASCAGHMTIVQYLLENGAVWKDVKDKRGMDAVDLARAAGHDEVADFILKFRPKCLLESGVHSDNFDQTRGGPNTFGQTRGSPNVDQTRVCSHNLDEGKVHSDNHDEATVVTAHPDSKSICKNRHLQKFSHYCDICKLHLSDSVTSVHDVSTVHQFCCQHRTKYLSYTLPQSNRGFQMMLRSGWNPDKGLGSEGQGRQFPVKTVLKQDRLGIGIKSKKPRVTHFRPGDISAVKTRRQKQVKKIDNKKERVKALRKEREWEINFRQYINSNDF